MVFRTQRRHVIGAFGLLLFTQPAYSQPTDQSAIKRTAVDASKALNSAFDAFLGCAVRYATRYAKTPAAPSDVAEAALFVCGKEHASFLSTVAGQHGSFTSDQGKPVVDAAMDMVRRAAIRTLIEQRYAAELLPPS